MMTGVDIPESKKARLLYLLGAVLTYLGVVGLNYIGGSSDTHLRAMRALTLGSVSWLITIIPQVLIQRVLLRLLKHRFSISAFAQNLYLNGPIAVLFGALLFIRCISTSPTGRFEQLIVNPVPSSVRGIEQGGIQALDSFFWVIQFEIGKDDAAKLLKSLHYSSTENEDFAYWQHLIEKDAGIDVQFSRNWHSYILQGNASTRRMFMNVDSNKVVFILDRH